MDKFFRTFYSYLSYNCYIRLMRLHQPIGIQLIVIPILWIVVYASRSVMEFLYFSIIFITGGVIVRGLGTVINDIADQDFDKKVQRTKKRPLASGDINNKQALRLLCVLLLVSFLILISLPRRSIYCGIVAICLIFIYPFVKRYSYFPQVFLGFTFNIGIFIAWFSIKKCISCIPILIYISTIFWTIGYDTIYAFQDKTDDKKIGIKSMALKLIHNPKKAIRYTYIISTFFLVLVGFRTNMNYVYYLVIVFGLLIEIQHIEDINLKSSIDCKKNFNNNFFYGILIFLGFILGKL